MYAVVRGGGVERYLAELPFSFNGVMRFRNLSVKEQALHGVLPVVDLTPPFDETRRLANEQPSFTIFSDHVEITRPTEPVDVLSAEEIAAATRKALDDQERLQAKSDAIILALINATPAQLINYARTNFPSMPLAEQNKMGLILYILAVAVRGALR